MAYKFSTASYDQWGFQGNFFRILGITPQLLIIGKRVKRFSKPKETGIKPCEFHGHDTKNLMKKKLSAE